MKTAHPPKPSTDAKIASAVGAFLFAFVMIPLRGAVIASYWGWFITPTFDSAPSIGIAQGIGLSFMFGILNVKAADFDIKPQSLQESWVVRLTALLVTLISWVSGWAVFQLIGWFS